MTFNASAVGNVPMIVFGEALQTFTVNFVQGNYTHVETRQAGDYWIALLPPYYYS